MNAVDLFAGGGGWTTGAVAAGCKVLWAANHWGEAVKCHSANHPDTQHVCQDLHQADWSQVPQHDLLLASPCCQGHSKARGKDSPQHDASRSTAWAVVSCAEYHRPSVVLVENVPEYQQWKLYPAWKMAMEALGYSITSQVIDAAYCGVPQHRERLFIVATRSRKPFELAAPKADLVPASTIIDFKAGNWSKVMQAGRAEATIERYTHGRKAFGERFVFSYYGNTKTSRSIHRPIGTITTRDRWGVVNGDMMRMLSVQEARAAMGFPADMKLPANSKTAMHLLGNAVCPPQAQYIIQQIMGASC